MVNLGRVRGEDGVGIVDITSTINENSNTIVTVLLSDGTVRNFTVQQGETGDTGATGEQGVSINDVVLYKTEGRVKTYHIIYSDGNYTEFTVTDGEDGESIINAVDVVEKDNMNPVTSNAVYEMMETVINYYNDDMSS